MINDFIINAVLGGLVMAIISGILGSFVLWKNMAYFGDALSHSSLLGVTIGILFNLNLYVAVILLAILFACTFNHSRFRYSSDTTLGIISYTALALSIIIASSNKIKIDLMSYLFGDILVINNNDIFCLLGCLVITLFWTYRNWSNLILFSISEELLQAEGKNLSWVRFSFSVILALFVAISFKIVGMLLVTAMLIIPAAAALCVSKSPLQMVLNAIIIGCASVIGGIVIAFAFNSPTGPAIIIASFFSLLFTNTFKIIASRI